MMVGKFTKVAASLGALALLAVASEADARAAGGRGGAPAPHAMSRPIANHNFRNARGFYPGTGGVFYAPDGSAVTAAAPLERTTSDVNVTYKYDVPWDWAHRYPPNVVPSDRPYVSSCTPEAVSVPGRNGERQIVNVTRCY